MTNRFKKQYKEGDTVWCSYNNGNTFHSGTLIGLEFKEDNPNQHLYVVEVNDKNTKYIDVPLKDAFIDYFKRIYSKSEMIELLGD